MKKSRFITALLALCIIVCGLASCKVNGQSNNPNSGSQSSGNQSSSDYIYSSSTDAVLVVGEGVLQSCVSELQEAYFDATGKPLNISDDENASHAIILGKTENSLSDKAYKKLNYLNSDDRNTVGYVIYSDGQSVAIAYTEDVYGVKIALTEGCSYFVNNYVQKETLSLKPGLVYEETFDAIYRQAERDAEELDLLWEKKYSQILSKVKYDQTLATNILNELKNLYQIYTPSGGGITSWIANLYCPENGGFYYSNSARNTMGYLPDLESTDQALVIINEMIGSDTDLSVASLLGSDTVKQIIKFVKSKQDSNNGYFYHPQWTREATDALVNRRGRDLSSAINILKRFGASPTYDTPSGVKGDGIVETITPTAYHSNLL